MAIHQLSACDYSLCLAILGFLKEKSKTNKTLSETQILGAQDFPVESIQHIFIWGHMDDMSFFPDTI